MRVVLVVVVEPPGDLPKHCSSVRQWLYASVVALECFDEGFSDAVRLRAVHRGEAWHQAEGGGEVERLPRGERTAIVGHSTACGAWIVTKRSSTASSIRSRTVEPLMPAPATACQASTSRSWASMTKTMRTISPFQQMRPADPDRRSNSCGSAQGRGMCKTLIVHPNAVSSVVEQRFCIRFRAYFPRSGCPPACSVVYRICINRQEGVGPSIGPC